MEEFNRLPRDEYFMEIAKLVALRGTCPRKQVGAVLVKDKKIISTGYNGAPRGMKHCSEVGCLIENNHCQRAVHAEQNALLQAGPDADGSTLYCTTLPCVICFKLLIQAGVKKIFYKDDYNLDSLKYWIKKSRVKVIKWKNS